MTTKIIGFTLKALFIPTALFLLLILKMAFIVFEYSVIARLSIVIIAMLIVAISMKTVFDLFCGCAQLIQFFRKKMHVLSRPHNAGNEQIS